MSFEIKEQKKELRKKMLQQRSELDADFKRVADQRLCQTLDQLITEKNYRVIHAYIPFAGEIDISPLLSKLLEEKRTVVCPKTLPKRQLENRILYRLDELETGIMGTQHPVQAQVYEGPIDLVIVPGLAFDSEHFRLGYGGAYYDTFLAKYPEAFKLGIFYPFQEVEQVPVELHDYCLDQLLIAS